MSTYHVDMMCDECLDGKMLPLGYSFASYPPKYPHKCDSCGNEATFEESYPLLVNKPAPRINRTLATMIVFLSIVVISGITHMLGLWDVNEVFGWPRPYNR